MYALAAVQAKGAHGKMGVSEDAIQAYLNRGVGVGWKPLRYTTMNALVTRKLVSMKTHQSESRPYRRAGSAFGSPFYVKRTEYHVERWFLLTDAGVH